MDRRRSKGLSVRMGTQGRDRATCFEHWITSKKARLDARESVFSIAQTVLMLRGIVQLRYDILDDPTL